VDNTSSGRPELTENTEERRLTAAVRSSNHQVHARLDLETHLVNESIAIRRNDRHVFKHDVIRFHKSSFSLEVLETHNFCTLLLDDFAFSFLILSDHNSLVSSDL